MMKLLTGKNEFEILRERKRIMSEYLKENDSFGLERLDGENLDISRLCDAVLQLPFLVSKKLVIITTPFMNKLICEALLDMYRQIPDEIDVVLVDSKADKRTKLYKELSAGKMVQEFLAFKGSSLEKWVTTYTAEHGSNISQDDARHLIDRVGANQMRLAREIEKLAYDEHIDSTRIDTLTDQSLRNTVFDLLDKTFASKTAEALRVYDDLLANKTDPNEVLALVGWQLHVIALVKYAGEGSSAEIASKTGLHPFVAGKTIYVARRLSAEQIKNSISSALHTDIAIKTTNIDTADAVRVLLLELSSL